MRDKEVINVVCGARLGRICDIVVSCKSRHVLGVVVPGDRRILRAREDLFIPWKNIIKIGDDVILVELLDGGGIVKEKLVEEIVE